MSDRPNMSEAEWQTRCELAALYRVCEHMGWTDLINTHLSARVPGEPNSFLINRYGEMFDEITASSLIKMDFDGNVLGEAGKFNNAGFTIHSAVLRARSDMNFVMHTHTRAGAGVSLLENGLRPISQDCMQVYDEVAYHDYGVPASQEECNALMESVQHGTCVMLMNHGLLTCGETVNGTFMRMYSMERACELELLARTMNATPVPIAPDVVAKAAERMKKRRATPEYGKMEWEGVVRTVERKGTNYKH